MYGQEHLLRWWHGLTPAERLELLSDIEAAPWEMLSAVIRPDVQGTSYRRNAERVEPAAVFPQTPREAQAKQYERARQLGERRLADGKVAALTVAGGQGTRLGFDGPKGAVLVTPIGERSLFELFGKTVAAARKIYGSKIPWYVMTSPANHAQTAEFFRQHEFFGLPLTDVTFFEQGVLPLFGQDGRALLAGKGRLAQGPDGHGGSLRALVQSGALWDMKSRGVETISYFQVDNPLVKPFDPLFLGLHAMTGSEMSTKVAAKADDLERVGNVCLVDGRVGVVEYTEFPEALARAKNPDGTRRFNAANLAMHALDIAFVERVVGRSLEMPIRRAEKAVPFIDEAGVLQRPSSPNAIKLEMFIFDVLRLARNPLVLEVDRAEEFSPVKNATGPDSLETSRRDQVRRACRWLEAAGISVPRRPDGEPDVVVAISPSFALDAADVKAKAARVPKLRPGEATYIA